MKVIFLDTNVYLHCRPVEEIDWQALLGTDNVEIIVPRVTLHELDKQKNTNTSSKIRERARNVLKKLEAWLETSGQEIRPGVRLTLNPSVPRQRQIESYGLNPEWEDDVLLATVCVYKGYSSNKDISVVTQDIGPRLSAKNLNLTAFQLPDEYRLPSEPDPLEKENNKLRRQILVLENAVPKLQIMLETDTGLDDHKTWSMPKRPPYPAELNTRLLDEQRKKYCKHMPPSQQKAPSPIQAMLSPSKIVDARSYERYNNRCEDYIQLYEKYLKELWEHQKAVKLIVPLRLLLINSGTKPGEDIDCYFHFPDGFDLFDAADLGRLTTESKEPDPPLPLGTFGLGVPLSMFTSPRALERTLVPPSNVSGLSIRRSSSYDVQNHVQRIKHGDKLVVASLIIQFKDYDKASSFGVEYRLHAANVPEQVTGQLHVIIVKS